MASLRRKEAKRLLDGGFFDGAYYLSGYVVELALKAYIAKSFERHTWPDKDFVNSIYTHNLRFLLKTAGLKTALDRDIKRNSTLEENWLIVNDWNERSRYERWSEHQARDLYSAVTSRRNGVLPWIKRHW